MQRNVRASYVAAIEARKHAARLVKHAEAALTQSLGLDALDLSPSLHYSRPFRDLLAARRFDAEYFNPRYQRVLARLEKGAQTIGDVADSAERRFLPGLAEKGSTFNYIEIGSLTADGQAEAESIAVADAPTRAQCIVEPGDVITSTVRPIRRLSALINDEQRGFVCSSGFAVLHPKPGKDGVEPEVLLTYLRLPIICEIMDLHTTASMYPAIPVDRLLSIPISLPKQSVRDTIVEKVRASFAARRESARLLEQAKTTVENMILGNSSKNPR